MKQLFSKFLVAFLLTSAVVLSWSEYFLVMLITHLTHFQTSTIGEQYKKREFFCNHSFGQTGRLRLSGHLNSNTVLPTIKLVQIGNFSNFGILKVAIFGKRAIFGTLKCHF